MTSENQHSPRQAETERPAVSHGRLGPLLSYQLRRAAMVMAQRFDSDMAAHEITLGQLSVLLIIEANPGLNQTSIGKALGIDRSTLVSILDTLETKGAVQRTPSRQDRRSHALHLTTAGVRFIADLVPKLSAYETGLAGPLTAPERENLIVLLEKIIQPDAKAI